MSVTLLLVTSFSEARVAAICARTAEDESFL